MIIYYPVEIVLEDSRGRLAHHTLHNSKKVKEVGNMINRIIKIMIFVVIILLLTAVKAQ